MKKTLTVYVVDQKLEELSLLSINGRIASLIEDVDLKDKYLNYEYIYNSFHDDAIQVDNFRVHSYFYQLKDAVDVDEREKDQVIVFTSSPFEARDVGIGESVKGLLECLLSSEDLYTHKQRALFSLRAQSSEEFELNSKVFSGVDRAYLALANILNMHFTPQGVLSRAKYVEGTLSLVGNLVDSVESGETQSVENSESEQND